jgi:hypothetical protein
VTKSGPAVGLDVAGGDLDADRAAARELAQLVDLAPEIGAAGDVGVTRGADDVLALGEAADGGDLCRDLGPGKVPAHAGLGRLAELDLDGVDARERLGRDAVAVGDILEDESLGEVQRLGQDAAFARGHGRAGRGAASGERGVGLPRQGPE